MAEVGPGRPARGEPSRAGGARAALTAGAPAVALVVIVASLMVMQVRQDRADGAVVRAGVAQKTAEAAIGSLVDAETAVRGYVATGQGSYLGPYRASQASFGHRLDDLAVAVAPDPAQAARVAVMRRLAGEEMGVLGRIVARPASSPGPGPSTRGDLEAGRQIMDALRAQAGDVETAARGASVQAVAAERGFSRWLVALSIAAAAAGAALGVGLVWLSVRAERSRREAERESVARALSASESIRESQASMLAALRDGVFAVDASGRCLSVNPAGAAMLGYHPGEMIGRDLHALIHHGGDGEAHPPGSCTEDRWAWRAGRADPATGIVWRRDGTRLAIEYIAVPVDDGTGGMAAVINFKAAAEATDPAETEAAAADLRRAIGAGELVVHYQPQVSLPDGRVRGVEALVRWAGPGGLVTPDRFVPLAERAGLMGELTDFVLGEVLAQHARWKADGLELTVAANLSVANLTDGALPARLAALCRRHRVPPRALELEVTETGVMADPEKAVLVLSGLAAQGFSVGIDDFGTGFSSLAYLRDLPASVVKIDKSFVEALPRDPDNARIVRGVIDLAHGLGKRVVAEGVETAEATEFLVRAGCDAAQGYYWSRPLAPGDLARWARRHEQRRTGDELPVAGGPPA